MKMEPNGATIQLSDGRIIYLSNKDLEEIEGKGYLDLPDQELEIVIQKMGIITQLGNESEPYLINS